MNIEHIKRTILDGKAILGVELGSTRIKAVLIGEDNMPIAAGEHEWENKLVDHIWTYDLEEAWKGIQASYRAMASVVEAQYGIQIRGLGAIGISGMMHGYMAFDQDGKLLVPFRTWRNTCTKEAAEKLTEVFAYNIPQRFSIAHLYQAILNGESHVSQVSFFTTLAGYIHWKLTGKKVLGVGEASGMFPIDTQKHNFNKRMIDQFDTLVAEQQPWKLSELMPTVLVAGEHAGVLSEEGVRLLDPTRMLRAGIPLCPPEGDAGTGMTATNSVARRTGNVSAGTSVFAMLVLEEELKRVHEEIDLVTTPAGDLVAMVHCNNCTSDLNAWVNIFKEFSESVGADIDTGQLFETLYNKALEGDADCGGMLAYNYFSGEHITGFEEGRPLFVRTPNSRFNLANFIRVHLYTALGALKTGLDILLKEEGVKVDILLGHGGLFKTKGVGQRIMAAAVDTPVMVMETAGEGGAWGIALLAAYMRNKADGETLDGYLKTRVFAEQEGTCIEPIPGDVAGYDVFIRRYNQGLAIERVAVEALV